MATAKRWITFAWKIRLSFGCQFCNAQGGYFIHFLPPPFNRNWMHHLCYSEEANWRGALKNLFCENFAAAFLSSPLKSDKLTAQSNWIGDMKTSEISIGCTSLLYLPLSLTYSFSLMHTIPQSLSLSPSHNLSHLSIFQLLFLSLSFSLTQHMYPLYLSLGITHTLAFKHNPPTKTFWDIAAVVGSRCYKQI